MVSPGREHKDDLEYAADELRDNASSLGKERDPTKTQASMQEETAKAIHRLAAAVENQNAILQDLSRDIERVANE